MTSADAPVAGRTIDPSAATDPGHCRTQLLSDEPTAEDTFGGPHGRLAKAITDLIRDEDGGRAIGLEGGWGAGKSTVVNLVSKQLEENGDGSTRVAVFDVWAHQGDPLRRTFLEQLIWHAIDAKWVDRDRWKERIERLTKRRRDEIQRVIPQLTSYGVVFSLSLLAIPVGSALLAAGGTSLNAEGASARVVIALLAVGLLTALAPLLVLAWFWVERWWHRRNGTRAEGDLERAGGFPALVTGQSTTEILTSVTETPDPTSVEFESIFRELCDEALECEEHRLVLAIDNLDRVEPQAALAVWATLQTFLQYSEHDRPSWIRRLWVVVPFDRDGILSLWGGDDVSGRLVGESFLAKTFQIRFRIPPPAISDWRKYLRRALADALPDHSEDDFHDVYRAFALRTGTEAAKPKPRDLKLFVNEIGAIHRQWQHTDGLALSDFAGFVLLQRDDATEKAIRSTAQDEDSSFARRVLGENWRDTLAILLFNAPISQARQMLLREPIETALSAGRAGVLRELEAAHREGFWAVFEDSVPAGAPDWGDVGPQDFARAARALAGSELFEDSPAAQRREAASVLDRVRTAALAVNAWEPFTVETAEGLVSLCHVVGAERSLPEALLRAVGEAAVPAGQEEPAGAQVSPLLWMRAALVLLKGLDELGFASTLVVPFSSEQWIDVGPQLPANDADRRLQQHLDLRAAEEIDGALAERCRPEQIDDTAVAVLEVTLSTRSARTLVRTASQVVEGIRDAGGVTAPAIAQLIRALDGCRSANLVDHETYTQLATGGSLLHHLYRAFAEGHAEAMARCAFAYLQSIPDASAPTEAIGNSQAGHEQLLELLRNPDSVPHAVDEFVAVVSQHGGIRELARIVDAGPLESALFHATFSALLEKDPAATTPEFIKKHWRKILSNRQGAGGSDPTDTLQAFLSDSPSVADLPPLVIGDPFAPSDAAFYLALLRASGDMALSAWCVAGLRQVEAVAWADSLTTNGVLVALLLDLRGRGETIDLGAPYLDGLTSHAQAAGGSEGENGIGDTLPTLIAILSAGNRELLTRRVYEILEGSDGKATQHFFELYGDLIARRDLLLGQPGFVDRVCRPLLMRRNSRGLDWLARVFQSAPDLLDNHHDHHAVADFRERMKDALVDAGQDGPAAHEIRTTAGALGIEPDPEPSKSDGSGSGADYAEPTESTSDE